ncbi:type I secretion system permease/ATPase [Pseudaquabacterium pictum]|uniref:Cyclolysin secretion/processing ATP-binding protein CyaB n=1 Tax=Pseudaquabacterium pictum TaxID=2315236 RepID=A0A480ATK4_9BURK|nr:type I secretion system permease/ATPase [Rubrivivax pictus]GCL64286.1 ABC transporter [Rubrivivax pictus]
MTVSFSQPTPTTVGPVPLHESVVFLARFLGTPVQVERLRDSLASHDLTHGPALSGEAMAELLRHAGLVGSPLPVGRPRRPTEMPALLLGEGGSCLVVVSMKDGRFECHVPGIDGSTWLSAEMLQQEVPRALWMAVRPAMHFDTRSLLYTLPQAKRWFWDTFNRNRWMFTWALLGTLALNLFGTLVPFYSMAVYDRVIPNNALGSLGVLTVAAVMIIGFELMMRLLRSHLLEAAARRIDVALSAQVFAQCLRMRAASRPASGGVLANTVRDFESVREFFATSTLTVLGDLPFMLLYLAVIALVGGWLAVVPLLAIPVLLGIALMSRRPLARKVNESMQESSQRTAHLFETMNGLDNIKSLGAEAWSRRKWESLTQAISQNSLETREISSRVTYLNTMVLGLANVAVVAVGAVLMSEHAMTLGQIIAVSLLTGRALAPVSQIAGLVVRWEQTKLSYEALDKIMKAPTDEAPVSLQAPPMTGRLEFRDVNFAYPGQPPVVEGLNLRIRPGERVGIIGKLGSGKSTLLRLILNQYAPTTGSVLVDDIVNTQLEPLSLRRQIGYVPQDVTLFHGTLRENIELGRVQADDAALLEAMRVSGLDEIVAQLPGGVGTQVGERGERLSGGQRQIVAIARALLTKPRLLLMDEPSSMIDPGNEQKLIARLRALGDTTIVLVTHRMAMLALVDRLVVMDRGRVVADGRRDEVLRALAQQQGGGATKPAAGAEPGNPPASPAANDPPQRGAGGAAMPTRAAGGPASFVADRLKGQL